MVGGGCFRWGVGVLLLVASMPGLQAAQLQLALPARLEQGRQVRAVLSTDRLQDSLARVDLSPLESCFVLERSGEVELDRQHHQQRRILWLTPREAQECSLSPLRLGPLATAAQSLHIAPARDDKGGEAVSPRFPVLPETAWARQQLVYAVILESPRRFLRLQAEAMELDGFQVFPIPQQVEALERDGKRWHRHTSGWVLLASRPGRYRIRLPALQYGREGVVSHRFYPPPQSVRIDPLPDYLPPGLAVGELKVEGDGRPWGIVRRGELQQRGYTVTTRGVSPSWRPTGVAVTEGGAVRLYEIGIRRSQMIDGRGVTVRYHYSLPLSIESSGWHSLPPLAMDYFEPYSGRLHKGGVVIALPLALSLWQEGILWLVLGTGLWFSARWGMRYLQGRYRYLRGYRSALQQLQAAQGLEPLWVALGQVALAEGWPANLSLSAWSRRWQEGHRPAGIDDWMRHFEAALYGGAKADVGALRVRLLALLRTRLGGWRRLCEFRLAGHRDS